MPEKNVARVALGDPPVYRLRRWTAIHCSPGAEKMIRIARFCKASSDSVCATVKLQCHTGLACSRTGRIMAYRSKAGRLFQRQLALVVWESTGGMQPWMKSRWYADPTSSHHWYGHQATWMCRLAGETMSAFLCCWEKDFLTTKTNV